MIHSRIVSEKKNPYVPQLLETEEVQIPSSDSVSGVGLTLTNGNMTQLANCDDLLGEYTQHRKWTYKNKTEFCFLY